VPATAAARAADPTRAGTVPALFPYVRAGHPLHAPLEELRAEVVRRGADHLPGPVVVNAEVKGRRTGTGWELDRFHCSLQSWAAGPRAGFAASTLYWSARTGRTEWLEFPDEAYLHGLRACLPPAGTYDVLRYVPLRRFTFRAGGVVVKAKRASRLMDSYTRAAALVAAAEGSAVRVPALRGVDRVLSVYRQDAVTGPPMSALVDARTAPVLLAQAGRVHAELHALPAPHLPARGPGDDVAAVRHAADVAAWLRPDLAARLGGVRELLTATAPAPSRAAQATCHGDLVPSHLLLADAGWTVIDLDLAHRGDRYRDLAFFLAGLPADVPGLGGGGASAAAQEAYLEAYEERSGRCLDRGRLAWHRAAAELHQLAVLLAKNALPPGAVEGTVAALRDAERVLREGPR
jgi:tRNA A-37 threonylcarbamoyl transferase component Bud32